MHTSGLERRRHPGNRFGKIITRLLVTILAVTGLTVVSGAQSAGASQPNDVLRCERYQELIDKDGRLFRNRGECLSHIQRGGLVYSGSFYLGRRPHYGTPDLPGYVTDATGDPVIGNSLHIGAAELPPNLALRLDISYPSGRQDSVVFTTTNSGTYFVQFPGIHVYENGSLVHLHEFFGGEPLQVVTCATSGGGGSAPATGTISTAFGQWRQFNAYFSPPC